MLRMGTPRREHYFAVCAYVYGEGYAFFLVEFEKKRRCHAVAPDESPDEREYVKRGVSRGVKTGLLGLQNPGLFEGCFEGYLSNGLRGNPEEDVFHYGISGNGYLAYLFRVHAEAAYQSVTGRERRVAHFREGVRGFGDGLYPRYHVVAEAGLRVRDACLGDCISFLQMNETRRDGRGAYVEGDAVHEID